MAEGGIALVIVLLFWCFGLLIGLGGTIFWIWMLIDAATKEPGDDNEKIVWVIVIALTHLLGAILYFLIRRPARIAKYGR